MKLVWPWIWNCFWGWIKCQRFTRVCLRGRKVKTVCKRSNRGSFLNEILVVADTTAILKRNYSWVIFSLSIEEQVTQLSTPVLFQENGPKVLDWTCLGGCSLWMRRPNPSTTLWGWTRQVDLCLTNIKDDSGYSDFWLFLRLTLIEMTLEGLVGCQGSWRLRLHKECSSVRRHRHRHKYYSRNNRIIIIFSNLKDWILNWKHTYDLNTGRWRKGASKPSAHGQVTNFQFTN